MIECLSGSNGPSGCRNSGWRRTRTWNWWWTDCVSAAATAQNQNFIESEPTSDIWCIILRLGGSLAALSLYRPLHWKDGSSRTVILTYNKTASIRQANYLFSSWSRYWVGNKFRVQTTFVHENFKDHTWNTTSLLGAANEIVRLQTTPYKQQADKHLPWKVFRERDLFLVHLRKARFLTGTCKLGSSG